MSKHTVEHNHTPKRLAPGEYLKTGHREDDQTSGARRVLVAVVQSSVPKFFEELRDRVYPKYRRYARVADHMPPLSPKGLRRGPGYWKTGWYYDTWLAQSGPNRFKPLLLSWAGDFGSAKETWVLEGALETLSAWHRHPDMLDALDVSRFCPPAAGRVLVDYETFLFRDTGWSPQFETLTSYRARTQQRFKEELDTYTREVRELVESRGGQRVQKRYSLKNFEWFVLYQLRGLSSVEICSRHATEESSPFLVETLYGS